MSADPDQTRLSLSTRPRVRLSTPGLKCEGFDPPEGPSRQNMFGRYY